jgi:apolipoprotein D and lipocalin family protein
MLNWATHFFGLQSLDAYDIVRKSGGVMINTFLFIITASAWLCSCSLTTQSLPPLEVVPRVEPARYTGTWYEIARYPNSFQKNCIHSSAVYKLGQDGSISVINSCLKKGVMDTVKGKARVVDPITNAKLKVSFFWPFWGDYWIIDLGEDFDYAVVSEPRRKYLWILARSPQMDDGLYAQILSRLREKGFDTSILEKNPAPVP